MDSSHKGQWCGVLVFSLFCAWTNGWANILRRGWFDTPSRPSWRNRVTNSIKRPGALCRKPRQSPCLQKFIFHSENLYRRVGKHSKYMKKIHEPGLRCKFHYIDVIMTAMPSQFTSLTVVYSTVYSDADQRKHQSSASLAFVWGIHRDQWIPSTKGQLRAKYFHLMTSSCYTTLGLVWWVGISIFGVITAYHSPLIHYS